MKNSCIFVVTLDEKHREVSGIFRDHIQADNFDFPFEFTMGFRQIFWKVFNRVRVYDAEITFSLFAQQITISKIILVESDTHTDITYTEGHGYFIILYVTLESEAPRSIKSWVNLEMTALKMSEAMFSNQLFEAISPSLGANLLHHYGHKNPDLLGVTFYDTDLHQNMPEVTEPMMLLTGLYHYGKVIFWRITRDQIDLEISKFRNTKSGFEKIGKLKLRLLNMKRFFSMKNVSNNPYISEYNRKISDKLRLGDLFNTTNDVQGAISESLDHLDKFSNYNTSKNVRRLLNITTFVALPFSVISCVMAINLSSIAVNNTRELFTNGKLIAIYVIGVITPIGIFTFDIAGRQILEYLKKAKGRRR